MKISFMSISTDNCVYMLCNISSTSSLNASLIGESIFSMYTWMTSDLPLSVNRFDIYTDTFQSIDRFYI